MFPENLLAGESRDQGKESLDSEGTKSISGERVGLNCRNYTSVEKRGKGGSEAGALVRTNGMGLDKNGLELNESSPLSREETQNIFRKLEIGSKGRKEKQRSRKRSSFNK